MTSLDGTTGANTLIGGLGNDDLLSYGGKDFLDGGAGDDEIIGDIGNQKMLGGDGNDLFDPRSGRDFVNGGAGVDTVLYELSAIEVTVDLGLKGAQKSKGDAKGDKLISIENLIGSSHNDKLTGNGLANELTGGEGRDILKGGGGADAFIYTGVSDSPAFNPNRDVILDFAVGVDKIDLSAIAGLTSIGGEDTPPTLGELRWFIEDEPGTKNDKTIVEIYLSTTIDPDFQIEHTGIKALSGTDFILAP